MPQVDETGPVDHARIEVRPTMALNDAADLARAYTPGVAAACRAIAGSPRNARRLTARGNSVALVCDGSAVLGLGDIGPLASLPVLEGKAALLKRFAGIDAWPLCLDTRDVDAAVAAIAAVAPGFGAINLEDIAAPRCFDVEKRLRSAVDVPVFHDDQHGTAIAVLGALLNALRVVGKEPGDIRIVMSGAGAAGIGTAAVLRLHDFNRIAVFDSRGSVHPGRDDLSGPKRWLAQNTTPEPPGTSLGEGLRGADVFIGVSTAGLLGEQDIAAMADGAIVFALANPDPEIDPEAARRRAAVVATGRSDYPNQINNVLVFPGVFRGLLDAELPELTADAQSAAARALAGIVGKPDAGQIVPSVFDERLVPAIADAIATG
jgi:malate dehydrogenase (oxaloacetate-decarboxylating)